MVVLNQLDQRLVEHVFIKDVIEFQRQTHHRAFQLAGVVEIVQWYLLGRHLVDVADCWYRVDSVICEKSVLEVSHLNMNVTSSIYESKSKTYCCRESS